MRITDQIKNTLNFTWGEALWLPQWAMYGFAPPHVRIRILAFAPKVQDVRDFIGLPMIVTSWWRPAKYNIEIGGAEFSQHIDGGALDFRVPGMAGDNVRDLLLPELETFGLRMENVPGASWVHIDDGPVINNRFFKP